jgi:hypothetical protein
VRDGTNFLNCPTLTVRIHQVLWSNAQELHDLLAALTFVRYVVNLGWHRLTGSEVLERDAQIDHLQWRKQAGHGSPCTWLNVSLGKRRTGAAAAAKSHDIASAGANLSAANGNNTPALSGVMPIRRPITP